MVQAVDLVSGSSVANSTGDGAPNTGEQEQKPDNETSVAPAAVEADATIGDNSRIGATNSSRSVQTSPILIQIARLHLWPTKHAVFL